MYIPSYILYFKNKTYTYKTKEKKIIKKENDKTMTVYCPIFYLVVGKYITTTYKKKYSSTYTYICFIYT